MFIKSVLATAAAVVFFATGSVSAATYNAFSHVENGSPEHSVWFSGGSNPDGATGSKANHFLFENVDPLGFGVFETNGNKATLTGAVANADGQELYLEMFLIEVANPGTHKIAGGSGAVPDPTTWTFYELDTTMTSSLKSAAGTFLGDFDIFLRGDPLKAQFGIGANDKDRTLLGFSTWVDFVGGVNNKTYAGDINIVLQPVPVPAAGLLLLGALGGLGAIGRRRARGAQKTSRA